MGAPPVPNTMLVLTWTKIGLVSLAVVLLLVVLSHYQRTANPHPEWVRKLMHMGSGLIALSLPWLFQQTWPVLVLAILAAAGMFALRTLAVFRDSLAAVTGNVLRRTFGEVCFPIGAGIIYALADGDRLLYSIPLLILTFADASAALIGVFYGVRRYSTADGHKTLEGSLAFFQTAFLSTLVPILLFTELGRTETLLIALLMALLSMLLDASAWWGLDNLLIPVLSFLLLHAFVGLDASTLTLRLVITIGMMILVVYWRKNTTLNDSAVLSTVIYGYLCWTLGGWHWLLPPLTLFLSYNALSPQDVEHNERPYTVHVVLGVGAVGIFWLFLADILRTEQLYYPFMLSFAAQLAMIGSSRHLRIAQQTALPWLHLRSVLVGWLVLFLPFALVTNLGSTFWLYAGAGLLSVGIGAVIFALTQLGPLGYRNSTPRWLLQTASAGLASLIGFATVQII